MPTFLDGGSKISRKRKRGNLESAKSGSAVFSAADEILLLENQILKSRRHFNSIATLLNYVTKPDLQDLNDDKSDFAAVALCRVFCRLMALGYMVKSRETSKNEILIVQWLIEKFREYQNVLLSMLAAENSDRSTTALTLLMRVIKEEAVHMKLSEDAAWGHGLFSKLLRTLVDIEVIADARAAFIDSYLVKYDDIRYYTFIRIR